MEDVVVDLADSVGCLGDLPLRVLRWLLAAVGVAIGAYLLFGDGVVDGGMRDLAGAALIVGSPILLILVPRWWRNV